MISTNHGLNLGQLYIQQNAVSPSMNLMFQGDVSLQSEVMNVAVHMSDRNMTDLESAKKSLVPLFLQDSKTF